MSFTESGSEFTSIDGIEYGEVFDTTTNQWSAFEQLPSKRYSLAGASDGSSIYAIGGGTVSGQRFTDLLRYTPAP
jgi:hypothetical protein